jgi:adenylate cyclase
VKQASQDSGDAAPAAREAADKGRFCGWRPTIAAALTVGFGLLVVVAVASVLWIALGAAQKNTVSLLRDRADLAIASLIDQIGLHLGAARQQSEFLARNIQRGEIDASDPDKLAEVMLGALAAAPQVTGIGFFSTEGWSLRIGRDDKSVLRLYDAIEQDPSIIRLVKETAPDAGPQWGGVFWVPSLGLPHLAIATPVNREGRYLGVISSVVSVKALSNYVDDFQLQTGLHAFILYGRDRVLAHPALIDATAGLGDSKPLPALAEVGDPLLAAIWNPGHQPLELLKGSSSSLLGHWLPLDNDEVYYLYRVIGGYGPRQLYMGAYAREDEIDTSEFDRLVLAAWVGLGILALSLIIAVILGRSIARPVRDLSKAAQAVSTFDFRRIAMTRGSVFQETDNAARAFNAMLSGLRWFETYVPRSLVLRLIHLGEDGVQSEERRVTVIFTDIAGFTAASQKLTPREIADFLNHHFGILATEIERSGGTVDKYIGDSVMAFWGAPDEQPDHAERACRAALEIAAALERDNTRRIAAGLPPVGLRVGIHSGPAIVGNIGAPGRVNYTLIGDTVNLANRLESFGKEVPQSGADTVVLLSEDTVALLGPDWRVENLGEHQMRGRAGKIGVFRLRSGKTGQP